VQALLTLDSIIRANTLIMAAWEKFKGMLDMVQMDPSAFGHDGTLLLLPRCCLQKGGCFYRSRQ
jgi:hypothetical protein